MVITVQDLFNVSKFNTKHDSKTCEGIPAKTVRLNAQEREFKAAPSQGKQERLSQEHSDCYALSPYLRTDGESKFTTVMQKQEGSLSLAC